ncbi:MAG: D-alanyl-D-alanine carboxypeptidase [Lentisphaerae bacterium]|jgi:serine-type D-Ala-D-Ala carboxypeptidase (penicillin-binding protein 5/6)|nr:D-alanyl-D-alanine carboxypeptidase [Lentisphaerota bacterium]MBT4819613.1 D-alanyl-D-alanine carboxypeptidase [Lentisphaerota bacterium]MBT5607285.1 D-alanyl-D-alanine carboxypeptidase [Lentisphaerota bacterium]MBT7058786.1 D-alanyl-D-alanine carboxypeptidase [Lentisphaerota bacterium]MBT7842404.1 D-alanyl-D-alanine carboxypeptidase [Lentisphaerota bacterium]
MRPFIVIAVTLVHIAAIYGLARSASPGRANQPPEDPLPGPEQTSPGTPPTPPPETGIITPSDLDDRSASLTPNPAVVRKKSSCKSGILVDWTNRQILWRRRDTTVTAIASLTKMMTACLLLEAVEARPELSLSTPVRVTPGAAKIAGSQVYLDPRETFPVQDLLKSIMIFSANDAAYLIAEFLGGGDPQTFVRAMNDQAKTFGLQNTHFLNPHGLPSAGRKENQSTALEMACLAGQLLEYPEIVRWSSTWLSYLRQNTQKPFQLVNRNRLVNPSEGVSGVNGMKTGFTSKAGYCVAATCTRSSRTLIAVVTGCPTSKERNSLVEALLEWGYAP